MTISDKLKHFEEVCEGDAQRNYDRMISEYTASLEKILKEHREQSAREAALRVQAESEKIGRYANRELSMEQIRIKRTLSRKQEELKGKIFSELKDRLARFMETPEYVAMLERQILQAKEFSGGETLLIFIDPGDSGKQNLLALRTGCGIEVGDSSFMGGTQAVIASKNVLIDNSFATKIREAEEDFQFLLGGK